MITNFIMKHIPNFITSLNLTSGFIAIIFAANGDIVTASWLILAAMIFDFLDGFSARLLKAYSEIGKELDSLADVVSFGVAPGFIIYQLLNSSLAFDAPRNSRFYKCKIYTYTSYSCNNACLCSITTGYIQSGYHPGNIF